MLESYLAAIIRTATPLLLAGMGSIISERVGVFNISLEGAMNIGAFVGVVCVYYSAMPIGIFIEAAVLSNQTDGTVLVIKSGANDIKEELDAIAQLEKANARILGVALNGMRYTSNKYSYYNYYKDNRDYIKKTKNRRQRTRKAMVKN